MPNATHLRDDVASANKLAVDVELRPNAGAYIQSAIRIDQTPHCALNATVTAHSVTLSNHAHAPAES